MRNFSLPHAMKWVVACVSCIVGSLIFQGCGDNSPDPYAELDAAYPNGPIDAQKRTQDRAYMTQISEGTEKISSFGSAVSQCETKLEFIRNEIKKGIELRTGGEVPDVILEEALAKSLVYQEALKKYNEAKADLDAQRQKNLEMVRNRVQMDINDYNAKKAEADAKARALGLPTRDASAVNLAKTAAEQSAEKKPATPAPTVEALSRETGIPVAPAAAQSGN